MKRSISILALAAAALSSGCVTWTPRSRATSSAAVVVPNMPMEKWGVESCGAGSLSTILRHYGDPTSMEQWDATLPKMRGGVLTVDMLLAARQKGYEARIVTGTPEVVYDELRSGRPVILMLQVIFAPSVKYDFYHYIVADGIDPERHLVRTQFGDGKARWLPLQQIEKAWSGGGHAAILIRPRTLEESLRAAVELEDNGKIADAAAQYLTLTQSHPDSVVVWTDYGNAEMQLGKTAEAERAFRQALALDSGSRDAMNNLAWLLYQQKRLDEAEALARKAASQNGPDSYLVLDTLARVLAAKGSCEEALRTFRQAIDAVPASRGSARAGIESGMADAQRSCSSSSS